MSHRLPLITLILGILTDPTSLTLAQAAGAKTRAEVVEPSIATSARFPWYDADADRLQPIPLSSDPPLPGSSDWVWNRRTTTKARNSAFWDAISQILQYAAWITLGGLLLWLAVYGAKALTRDPLGQNPVPWDETHRRRHEADSIEQLPFQVQRPQNDLLNEARRRYDLQDYRGAIVYLFSYQLVQLDRHQRIHLAKGKTNRQYLFELGTMPPLRRMLNETMLAFEDVYFGQYPLGRERFEACWTQLGEFDRLLQSHSTSTR